MSSLAIDLAVAGCGLALGQRMLARDELAAGRLIVPFAHALPLGHAYSAVHPHSRAEKQAVRLFIDWARHHL
jgi:LysR family glycine cleavage system transcriptional activator